MKGQGFIKPRRTGGLPLEPGSDAWKRWKHWNLIYPVRSVLDPATGKRKQRQKWIAFDGTAKEARKELARRVVDTDAGRIAEPSKVTLGEWLTEWLKKYVAPKKTPATSARYTAIVTNSIVPSIGSIRVQALDDGDLQAYYDGLKDLSPSTKQIHHAILHSALKRAVRAKIVVQNVAANVEDKPTKPKTKLDVRLHVWTPEEAQRFLKTAKAEGVHPAAFYALALDCGARRGELAALKWSDLDLATGKLTIERKLERGGRDPIFAPTKTKQIRTVTLSPETVALLKAHKAAQAELKLKNRKHYHDLGLMFAKTWGDLHGRADSLGLPLQVNTIGEREFGRLIRKTGVKRIRFHDLRHTCASLSLLAGVQMHTVQQKLGHTKIAMTADTYAHVLDEMQVDAAARLAKLLHG